MLVMKFGGTSLGNAEMIMRVSSIIKENLPKNPVIVVSAVTKITDLLLTAANKAKDGSHAEILAEINKRHAQIIIGLGLDHSIIAELEESLKETLSSISKKKGAELKDTDLVSSFGERISSRIISSHLNKIGINAKAFDSYDLGMITDERHGEADIIETTPAKINESIMHIPKGTVPVITGFIGKTTTGEISTLGRGGSDYSAAIIGAAINATEVQIWTDVNGIMSADPKMVKDAIPVDTVNFDEASELAYLGAKVLHPKTILPLIRKKIPVRVLNTMQPHAVGTAILSESPSGTGITSIVCKKNLTIININSARMFMMHGFLHKIFKIFDANNVSVDMIATSEVSVSVTIDGKNLRLEQLINELSSIAEVTTEPGRASISVVGKSIKRTPGISSRIFTALSKNSVNVEMISQGASEINIGLVVKEEDAEKSVQALHREFFGGG